MKDRRSNRWHAMQIEDVLRAFAVNRYTGLTSRESAVRRLKNGNNSLWASELSGEYPSLFHQLFDYATVLFAFAVCLTALFSHGTETAAILLLLLISVFLRAATVLATRKIFRRYAKFMCPRCRVMREGKSRYVFAEQIVEGDIVLFSAGDTVPCDVRLISGSLLVSEIYFSKDRCRIEKDAGVILPEEAIWSQRKNILYAASTVLSGRGVGIAVATGERTYAFAQGGHIAPSKCGEVPLLRHISDWSHRISFWMMVVCGLYLLTGVFTKRSTAPIDELFISSIALIVASMSEFLSSAMLAAFACTACRLEASHSCIVKSASSIERLGNADWVVFGGERFLQSGQSTIHSFCDDRIQLYPYSPDAAMPPALVSICQSVERCLPKQDSLADRSATGSVSKVTEVFSALRKIYSWDSPKTKYVCIESALCNGLHTSLIAEDNTEFAYICGAVEDVIRCCSRVIDSCGTRPITAEEMASIYAYSRDCDMHARQTIAVARRTSPFHRLDNPTSVHNSMTFLGCFSVENPVDEDISHLTDLCRQGGIRMAVLCNDLCGSKYLAAQAGIFTESDRACTADAPELSELLSTTEAGNLVIQANSTEKTRIVRELRSHSNRVIYVGDGLSDLSCVSLTPSVIIEDNDNVIDAVSRRAAALVGSPTAKDARINSSGAADVLRTIAASRSAVINLRWMALYLILTQSMRVVLALFSIFTDMPLMSSAQLLLLGCVLDFLAVLMIAFRHPTIEGVSISRRRMELPAWNTGILAVGGIGILAGLLLSLVLLLLERFSLLFDPEAIGGVRLIGAIVVSFIAAHMCAEGKVVSVGRRFGVSTIHFVYIAITCLLLVGMICAVVAKCHITDWQVWAGCGLPAIVCCIMLRVYKNTQ